MKQHSTWLVSAFFIYALIATGMVLAAPKPELWPRWQAYDPRSAVVVDHARWSSFLGKYPTPGRSGDVATPAYASVTAADRQVLGDYINGIDTSGRSTSAGLRHADAGKQRLYKGKIA